MFVIEIDTSTTEEVGGGGRLVPDVQFVLCIGLLTVSVKAAHFRVSVQPFIILILLVSKSTTLINLCNCDGPQFSLSPFIALILPRMH